MNFPARGCNAGSIPGPNPRKEEPPSQIQPKRFFSQAVGSRARETTCSDSCEPSPGPVVLQLVKTFPRHRICSQSGHLSSEFQGEGASSLPSARHCTDQPLKKLAHETPTFLSTLDLRWKSDRASIQFTRDSLHNATCLFVRRVTRSLLRKPLQKQPSFR